MIEYVWGTNMSSEVKKIEIIGHVDENHHLEVDIDVPFEPGRVKIIVFPQDETKETVEDDLPVDELLRVAQAGGAFDFWNDPDEDLYTMEDGKPVE